MTNGGAGTEGDKNPVCPLGTLGRGNHFIEFCLDGREHVRNVLHAGSRGIGDNLGTRSISDALERKRQGDGNHVTALGTASGGRLKRFTM
jgi:RNA-splicing ligase RtcB